MANIHRNTLISCACRRFGEIMAAQSISVQRPRYAERGTGIGFPAISRMERGQAVFSFFLRNFLLNHVLDMFGKIFRSAKVTLANHVDHTLRLQHVEGEVFNILEQNHVL